MADVPRWESDSMDMVKSMLEYANGGVYMEEADRNIRTIRNMLPILMAAANQAAQVPRAPPAPPPPIPEPPEEVTAAAARRRA